MKEECGFDLNAPAGDELTWAIRPGDITAIAAAGQACCLKRVAFGEKSLKKAEIGPGQFHSDIRCAS
jgi:hypothetical protein